ncbi:MAG TPA: glycosyltransferase [Candidatus Saccharibacteria bacterium]|nr:glycosyltransferase [Candidatus Saccharibacteria bacterium]HRK94258.1 glycosyltransferase [Candidatus Saccharibacteria bacterium]
MGSLDIALVFFFVASLAGCARLGYLLNMYKYNPSSVRSDNLPSVSVCIAARNERHALSQCLEHVLSSDYDKLEILVLDDSSDDDTSAIIKSFASEGVRFIPGKTLPVGWLGKNHAYYTLSLEASSDILLFLDVDTLIAPHTVRQLVNEMVSSKSSMLSVLPRREDSARSSAILGTMRYLWELFLSSKQTPPAASAIWLIDSNRFNTMSQNMPFYAADVRLETSIAGRLAASGSYKAALGTRALGVRYEKHWKSQAETAIRLYYPFLESNGLYLVMSVIYLTGLLFTIGLAVMAGSSYAIAAVVLYLVICLGFGSYTTKSAGGPAGLFRVFLWPVLLVQEIILLIVSAVRYRLKTVTWKGRNLAEQPVNHSHLRLDE